MQDEPSVADQYRLCCGFLLEADLVDGRIVLRCLRCGRRWERMTNRTLRETDAGMPEGRTH